MLPSFFIPEFRLAWGCGTLLQGPAPPVSCKSAIPVVATVAAIISSFAFAGGFNGFLGSFSEG